MLVNTDEADNINKVGHSEISTAKIRTMLIPLDNLLCIVHVSTRSNYQDQRTLNTYLIIEPQPFEYSDPHTIVSGLCAWCLES